MYNPPTLDEEKLVYFGPQTKKLLSLINLHPNGLFSKDYRGQGLLRPDIFTRAKDWSSLASANPKMAWGPQKIFNRENLKFGLKFNVLRSITSGLVGVSSRDFFQSTSREAGVITCVQFLQGPSQNFVTAKNRPKFWNGSTYRNRKSSWKSATPPTLDEKKLVYFGPQTKKLLTLINLHPNGFFGRLHFGS